MTSPPRLTNTEGVISITPRPSFRVARPTTPLHLSAVGARRIPASGAATLVTYGHGWSLATTTTSPIRITRTSDRGSASFRDEQKALAPCFLKDAWSRSIRAGQVPDFTQREPNIESLMLRGAQLVERQGIDPFDQAELGHETGEVVHRLQGVGPAGYQDVPDTHRDTNAKKTRPNEGPERLPRSAQGHCAHTVGAPAGDAQGDLDRDAQQVQRADHPPSATRASWTSTTEYRSPRPTARASRPGPEGARGLRQRRR